MLQDQHRLIVEALDDLIKREVQPVAARIDTEDSFPDDAMAALGRAGYLGSVLPKPYGAESDLLSYALCIERVAAVSPSLAWVVVVHVSASMAIASTGTEEQRERFLPRLATGESLASFAFTETHAGADFFAVQCTARATEGEYRVEGAKTFISLADRADLFVTLAATEREGERVGPSMLVIERECDGFGVGSPLRGMGMRGIAWGELVFTRCCVPADNLLGTEGKGTRVVFGMAGPYLLGAAALALGIASGAYELTRLHLQERKVNDKPIGELEALQFRMADLSAKVEAARALVYRACGEQDPRSFMPFQAKLFASEIALDVTRAAVQLNGAAGYTDGSHIQRLARDAFAMTLHFENNDFLRRFLGRSLVGS